MIEVEAQLRAAREEIRRMLLSAGVDTSEVTVLLNHGEVTSRILRTVAKEHIDLLVMGTHGHRGFNRFVTGSVTADVLHRTPCPVLIINRSERVHPSKPPVKAKTILLATDFSSCSDRALAYALKWACEWGERVVLFHAVSETTPGVAGMIDLFPEYNPYFERQMASAWSRIHHLVPSLNYEIGYEVRHGNPKTEIVRVAEEKGADLIVTGARGAGDAGSPWGSVSSAVVRDSHVPVLVVSESTEFRSRHSFRP
jgi:nucleotide-binding universal stress UspA family protein